MVTAFLSHRKLLLPQFSGYEGNEEELGAYVSTDGYEVSVDKDEITLVTHLTYENRTADLSIVFNKKSVAQSVTLDPNYSLGEILEKALMNTILGMGTVFSVLIFISLIIYCFNFIPAIQKKFSKKKEDEKQQLRLRQQLLQKKQHSLQLLKKRQLMRASW